VAGILCAVMCTNTVFAAEPIQQEKYVLTYEQAVEMAINNNSTLSTLEESMDYMDKSYGLIKESLGPESSMIYMTSGLTISALLGQTLSTAKTLDSNIKTMKYNKQMLETGCEYLVKTYFANLIIADKGLEMMEKSVLNQQVSFNHSVIKNSLGMISDTELQSIQASLAASKASLEKTKYAVENAYNSFAVTIGLNKPEGYVIDYSVEYKPLELNRSVDSYIAASLSTDPSIKVAELKLNLAEQMKNISVYETTPYSYLEKEYNVNSASRDLGDTKKAFENNIRTAYNNIRTYEAERVSLEKALEEAKTTYNTVLLNYELGNVTELTVNQTYLALLNAESNLLKNTFDHDLAVFGFNNPSILSSQTSTNAAVKQ